jgi:hypothetical protein
MKFSEWWLFLSVGCAGGQVALAQGYSEVVVDFIQRQKLRDDDYIH